jgi:hypothetical protein
MRSKQQHQNIDLLGLFFKILSQKKVYPFQSYANTRAWMPRFCIGSEATSRLAALAKRANFAAAVIPPNPLPRIRIFVFAQDFSEISCSDLHLDTASLNPNVVPRNPLRGGGP